METIIVALIVAVLAPLILGYLTNRARRAEKLEDWARQDVVAEKIEEQAQLLLERDAVTAKLLEDNNQLVADTASATQDQLQVIHGLVNSDMTRIIEEKLAGLKRELIMMRLLAGDLKVGSEAAAAIEAMESQISDVSEMLGDRLAKAAELDDQIASQSRREDNA
jgi:uncharacterized membrane-anchored protein YhcB (DUF1043 family)